MSQKLSKGQDPFRRIAVWLRKVRELPTWKKVLLATVIIVLPAGIALGAMLYAWWMSNLGKSSKSS